MAFLAGSQVFLFLRREDLYVFFESGQTKQIFFPETVIKNLEVVDKKLFEKILREFFSHLPGQKGALFLSHAMVFEEGVKIGTETIADDELNKFVSTIPLQPAHIGTKVVRTQSHDLFFAANSDIYETIFAIAAQYGWQIKYIVPLALFDKITAGAQLSYPLFCRLLKEQALLDKGNFLQREEGGTKRVLLKRYWMLGGSLLFLLGALLFAAYTFHFFPFLAKQHSKQTVVISPTKQPVVSNTPTPVSAEEEALRKEDIKIQVLNGSGVAGQASRLKDQLEALGFSNVEIGNAEGPISNATIVIFSEKVAQELQDGILAELEKTFVSVDTQRLTATEGFDVSITTGDIK